MIDRGLKPYLLAIAIAGGTLAGTGGPASAQWFFGPPVLPERAVVSVLRQEGFRRISPPILNRDVYFLDAVDPYGDPVRVIVDAYNGHILDAHVRRNNPWVLDDPDEQEPQPRVAPRRQPQKQAAAPKPAPREVQPLPERVTPAPKLQRTPLAQPKAKPGDAPAKPPVAAAPVQGTKAAPRVIEGVPPVTPPVAPLDDVKPRAEPPSTPTPYVPPAPLE